MTLHIGFLSCLLTFSLSLSAQSLYFPPLSGSQWDNLSPDSLNWCEEEIDSLYQFLDQENTKAFIVLKDGKIVLEKYFDSFTVDSNWYWASASKGLIGFMAGQAQEDGLLNLNDPTSSHLGPNWSIAPSNKEALITLRNLVTMTSGLDDGVPNNHCTLDTCLEYLADAGTRWAYHNAPFTLFEEVLVNASGQSLNAFTQQNVKAQIGMNGFWLQSAFNNLYFSTPRSFARWGLLIQNQGVWGQDTLLFDSSYFQTMLSPSQSLNPSYGYLWWLGGQSAYMIPSLQTVFPGSFAPDAPTDMVAGLGANGQIVSVEPNKGLVWVRMGNAPSSTTSTVPSQFCNEVWKRLNLLDCGTVSSSDLQAQQNLIRLYPNPNSGSATLELPNKSCRVTIIHISGQEMMHTKASGTYSIATHLWPNGQYFVKVQEESGLAPQILPLTVLHQ